mgnify:CR=1 FL=1
MSIRPGYFKLPPTEIGATLIFVPSYTRGLSALELARWGQTHGYGKVEYIPASRSVPVEVHA